MEIQSHKSQNLHSVKDKSSTKISKQEIILDYFHRFVQEVSKLSKTNQTVFSNIGAKLEHLISDKSAINKSALSDYLLEKSNYSDLKGDFPLIYPFGCNKSQAEAVERAFTQSLSIIQGPPGTGKTQTILNIIANLLIRNKTVAVVSNNNSATKNVQEKLASSNFHLGWLVAELGSNINQEAFFKDQPGIQLDPDWERIVPNYEQIAILEQSVKKIYQTKVEIQELEEELHRVEQNIEIFFEDESDKGTALWLWAWYNANLVNLSASKRQRLKERCINLINTQSILWKWIKRIVLQWQGIIHVDQIENNIDAILSADIYADAIEKKQNLTLALLEKRDWLVQHQADEHDFIEKSRDALFSYVWHNFNGEPDREYSLKDYRTSKSFWQRYPIVTSSTFSLHKSRPNKNFDFVIIDEASQVNLPTAAICLSCAQRAVIVGDLKQLPVIIPKNVIKPDVQIPSAFDPYKQSILSSISESLGSNAPQTILREHYRCHPDIIGFCNKRFYDNQLVVMTKRTTEKPVFTWIETSENTVQYVEGSMINARQIRITQDWLNAQGIVDRNKIGIISPYRAHANCFSGVLSDTVHRFQGRECDQIVFNTVNGEITEFNDDPHLINVAVSRAKSDFILVSPTYDEATDSNLACLVRYIRHLEPEYRQLLKSKYRSVFDVLYQNNAKVKLINKRKGESPAEALMRNLLVAMQSNPKLGSWDFVQEYPLRLLPKSLEHFNHAERRYMYNGARLDFLLFDIFDQQPIAVIEVDGASFHRPGTLQAHRDELKNKIIAKEDIPFFRFRTDTVEGQEFTKLESFLTDLYTKRNSAALNDPQTLQSI